MASTTPGIDISANNGQHIDFKKVRNSGVKFVFIKVSEGTYVNPYARAHARAAKAAGLLVGAYCFVTPKRGRTGAQEAEMFLKNARAAGLLEKGCLRPAADVEVTNLPAGVESRKYHYAFIERLIKELDGNKPFIYTAKWFWDGVLGAKNSHRCPLWLASYTPKWRTLIPTGWTRVAVHQYTDQAVVPGIAGHVDANTYFGTVSDLTRKHALRKSH